MDESTQKDIKKLKSRFPVFGGIIRKNAALRLAGANEPEVGAFAFSDNNLKNKKMLLVT